MLQVTASQRQSWELEPRNPDAQSPALATGQYCFPSLSREAQVHLNLVCVTRFPSQDRQGKAQITFPVRWARDFVSQVVGTSEKGLHGSPVPIQSSLCTFPLQSCCLILQRARGTSLQQFDSAHPHPQQQGQQNKWGGWLFPRVLDAEASELFVSSSSCLTQSPSPAPELSSCPRLTGQESQDHPVPSPDSSDVVKTLISRIRWVT